MEKKDWTFYLKTEEAWQSMKKSCAEAKKTIKIEQYIFEDDEIGREFIEIFIRKSSEGVKIRVLCDMVGSFSFYNSKIPDLLKDKGIEVRFFNVVKLWRIDTFSSWFFRDHRKILIVDDSVGFIGGVGVKEGFREWRDTHLKVTGKIMDEMSKVFEEMWHTAGARSLVERRKREKTFSRGSQFLTNSPTFKKRFLYYEIIKNIKNSKKYIYITTPYFVPDRRIVRVLEKAARRKVDVKILVPEKSNHQIVDTASHIFFDRLLRAGVNIYQYQGNMIHAKTILIDDNWSTVGSFNFDSLSFTWNYEANIVSSSEEFIKNTFYFFLDDLEKSKKITLQEWRNRRFLDKIMEKAAIPIRRFL